MWLRILSLVVLVFTQSASGQIPLAQWDRAAGESLKGVHDRGVDLYNAGDSTGAYRLYQGALLTVRPLLDHRPAVQRLIDDGLAEAAKSPGAYKHQAYLLHVTIEAARAELKKELPPPVATTRETAPSPRKSWVRPSAGPAAWGRVTLDGKPIEGIEVSFVSADRVDYPYTGTTTEDGIYFVSKSVPAGDYAMSFRSLTRGNIPGKYNSAIGSGFRVRVHDGENKFDFDLKSR